MEWLFEALYPVAGDIGRRVGVLLASLVPAG